MREVDDALSLAYAQRGAASPPSGLTPTPRWSSRTPEHEATSPSSGSEARSARTASAGRRTVTWHRHGESGGEPRGRVNRSIPRRSRNFSGLGSSWFWSANGATGSIRWPTA